MCSPKVQRRVSWRAVSWAPLFFAHSAQNRICTLPLAGQRRGKGEHGFSFSGMTFPKRYTNHCAFISLDVAFSRDQAWLSDWSWFFLYVQSLIPIRYLISNLCLSLNLWITVVDSSSSNLFYLQGLFLQSIISIDCFHKDKWNWIS